MDYTVHGILQARIQEWVAFPFPRGLPNPGIEPRSPTLWVDSLPAKPQGKPENTGVGSLQWIFPTEKLNQGYLNIIEKLWFHLLNKMMCVSKQKYFPPIFYL